MAIGDDLKAFMQQKDQQGVFWHMFSIAFGSQRTWQMVMISLMLIWAWMCRLILMSDDQCVVVHAWSVDRMDGVLVCTAPAQQPVALSPISVRWVTGATPSAHLDGLSNHLLGGGAD